ncbi:MAG: hypothetical protein Q3988_07275, partial [Gemella sp.]|nr:hypothetical protein [Gemella sp.]
PGTPTPGTSVEPTTIYVDENGTPLLPGKDGKHPFANIPGYELVVTNEEPGKTIHVYKKVPGVPTPGTPVPGKPSPKVSTPAKKAPVAGQLPKTSATRTETNSALPAGLAAALAAAGLLTARRRKEDK